MRSGDIKARRTSRGSHDVSHDDRHEAGASARSVLVSSLVQRRQARLRSTEASRKGCYIGATRPRPGGQPDRGHRGAHRSVTTRGFLQAKTAFVRIDYTTCPLSNPAVVESLPAHIGRRTKALYIWLSHHHRGGSIPPQATHQLKNASPPEACSSLVLIHP